MLQWKQLPILLAVQTLKLFDTRRPPLHFYPTRTDTFLIALKSKKLLEQTCFQPSNPLFSQTHLMCLQPDKIFTLQLFQQLNSIIFGRFDIYHSIYKQNCHPNNFRPLASQIKLYAALTLKFRFSNKGETVMSESASWQYFVHD